MIRKVLLRVISILSISSSAVANEQDITKLFTSAGIEGILLLQSLDGPSEKYQHNTSKIYGK